MKIKMSLLAALLTAILAQAAIASEDEKGKMAKEMNASEQGQMMREDHGAKGQAKSEMAKEDSHELKEKSHELKEKSHERKESDDQEEENDDREEKHESDEEKAE